MLEIMFVAFQWWSFTNFVQIKVPGSTGWSGGAMVLGKLPVPGRPT